MSNFLTYSFGAILIRGFSFFILPLIMYKISPSEYGTLSLTTAFTSITTAIIGLGLRQVLSIEYFHADLHKRTSLIQDILIIYTAVALPTTIFLWQVRSTLIRIIFFNLINSFQLLGILIAIFCSFYSELMYQLLQYTQAAKRLMILQCSLAFGTMVSTLVTVLYLERGITGILWSQTTSIIIAAIIAIIFLRKYQFTAPFTGKLLMPIPYYLWYGLPFIPGILASWILSSADRWILGYFTTMREVGIYAVADLASQLFYTLVLQSWAASYLPHIMKRYQEQPDNLPLIEEENHRHMWGTMIGLALIISLGYPIGYIIVAKLLPSSYHYALRYAWILLMGQIFLLGSYFVAAFIQYRKRTYFLAFALFIPAFLNIILNVIFIPKWGIMGCSIATLISYALYFLIIYRYNKKLIAMHSF